MYSYLFFYSTNEILNTSAAVGVGEVYFKNQNSTARPLVLGTRPRHSGREVAGYIGGKPSPSPAVAVAGRRVARAYSLFDCGSRGRYPRGARTLIPAGTCRPNGPAGEPLVPESRPAGDLHLRPRPHTEPVMTILNDPPF